MALESICMMSCSKNRRETDPKEIFEHAMNVAGNSHFVFEYPKVFRASSVARPYTFDTGNCKINFNHGTTCLAFLFQDGIIVAVDSRASAGGYIPWTDIMKIIDIDTYMLGTMAGGAADCQFWIKFLKNEARVYHLRNKKRMSVAGVSKHLVNMFHRYKGMGIVTCNMVCGWDELGPSIYYVDSDGRRYRHHLISVGSGATYAYGILDSYYSYDMNTEEAYDLARRAIFSAAYRDIGSGGNITVCHIKAGGWQKISTDDVMDLYDKYKPSINTFT